MQETAVSTPTNNAIDLGTRARMLGFIPRPRRKVGSNSWGQEAGSLDTWVHSQIWGLKAGSRVPRMGPDVLQVGNLMGERGHNLPSISALAFCFPGWEQRVVLGRTGQAHALMLNQPLPLPLFPRHTDTPRMEPGTC